MARRRGFFDDLMSIGLKLPWKVGVAAAVVIFVALRVIANDTQAPVNVNGLADMGVIVQHGFIHVFAELLQYIIPAGLLIGMTVRYFKLRQSSALLTVASANPKAAITSISWRDFEKLVGEVFRQRGFKVTGFGGNGPDGGADLGLIRNGERFLVQCKHWKKRQVGVTVVRELYGVISAQRARGGFIVTGGAFTREAREFAASCRVELIDGSGLQELIGPVLSELSQRTSQKMTAIRAFAPVCPRCGEGMVQREAKHGKFAGQSFWGCQQYPKCSGIIQIA
jgi:restriction system protein